jgi:predicted nucleotidyltransferase
VKSLSVSGEAFTRVVTLLTPDTRDPYNRAMERGDLDCVARSFGVRLVLQFGSSVTGKLHPRSDVDVAVLLERAELPLEEQARLLHELQRLFPDRDVDLAVLNHADPLFLKKVTESCRLLHGTPADLERLKLHAFKRYQDYRRYLDLERRFVARALTGAAARG